MKIFKITFFLVLLFFLCPHLTAWANNLTIDNVSLEDRNPGADTAVVEFDISWDNSWKDDTNHDAVWIFFKACEAACEPLGDGWEHGNMKTAGENPEDTDPGTNSDLDIVVASDKVGAFLRRKSSGTGTFSSSDVRLTLDYSSFNAADTDLIQVKVFGIEMVYIPEGDFYLGDGNGTSESTSAYHETSTTDAVQVTAVSPIVSGEGATRTSGTAWDDTWIKTVGVGIDGDDGLDRDIDGVVDNPGFPTGYNAFYLMKYELSQGEWRDFFNLLRLDQQDNRCDATLSGNDANTYIMVGEGMLDVNVRQTIKATSDPGGGPYTVECDFDDDDVGDEYNDGASIAMNHTCYMDTAAYLDWAGLRPITQLEIEKACRGTASAVYGEYAWGTTTITQAEGPIVNPGEGGEVASTTGNGLCNYNGAGTDINAPLRSGFAATSSSTRVTAGAGYYGNMNMNDNVLLFVASMGNVSGRGFAGTHGDGTLVAEDEVAGYGGNATNEDWPGIDVTTARGITAATGAGSTAGYYAASAATCAISDRTFGSLSSAVRSPAWGIRGGRSEPLSGWKVQTRTASTFADKTTGFIFTEDCWDTPANAEFDDGTVVTCTHTGFGHSYYLIADDFGFSIPTDATDLFIVVEVNVWASDGYHEDYIIKLTDKDEVVGDDQSRNTDYYTADGYYRYYTDGDIWGLASDSAAITLLNQSSSGVAFSCDNADGDPADEVYVDQIKMTVFYK